MSQKVIVTVKEGKLRGFKTKSVYSGKEFYSFLGVPYGQPTGGHARFKDPVKVKPWKGVLDATTEKEGCLQYSHRKRDIAGNEDCLYNNIHTTMIPSKDNNQLKAVVVNIHPGGLIHGSPDPDYYGSPEYIMNHDIVYVSVGYRLHILGNLNLNLENRCTGNQCLKDIILSLKWMRDNIHVFGGDPTNITLLGSSSGATLLHLLLLSPLTKGLYHKVIMMGMYAFNPGVCRQKEHVTLAYDIACKHGYTGEMEDKRKLLGFYKQMDCTSLLLSKLQQFQHVNYFPVFPCSPFTIMSEPSKNSPIPVPPRDLIPSTNRVPVMIGFCSLEGIMGVALLNKLKIPFSRRFHKLLTQNAWGWGALLKYEEAKIIQKEVEDFYLNGRSLDTASEKTKFDILTDACLSDVYDTLIDVVSSDRSSPVYVYHFTYNGKLFTLSNEIEKYFKEPVDGAGHAADYSYWCYTENRVGVSPSRVNPKDHQMIDTITNLFTSFAKKGDPNNDRLQVNWKPSTSENPCYLHINETLEVKDGILNGQRMEFWHNIKKRFQKIDIL